MKFLWRRNWTDPPIPVDVLAWMPLGAYSWEDRKGEHSEPAKVVAVAVVDNAVCSIDIDEIVVEREN